MPHRSVLAAMVLALAPGGFTFGLAQEQGNPAAGEVCASPVASPGATPLASTPTAASASPEASRAGVVDCATPHGGTPAP